MRPRLTKTQKTFLIQLIAEGLESEEINQRTEKFKKPFTITRQSIEHYRRTRKLQLKTIQAADELSALNKGLALKENRVRLLEELAALMTADLLGGHLWLEQVKSIGSGATAEVIDYDEFNKGEVESLRGVLDDIAREVGGRRTNVNLTWEQQAKEAGYDPEDIRAEARKRIGQIIPGRLTGGGDGRGVAEGQDAAPSRPSTGGDG